jgi:hypothetical protein
MLIPLHESVGSAGTASGNILSNGGFEERGEKGLPSGWQIMPERDGKGDAVLDTKSVHSGTYSLKITPPWEEKETGPQYLVGDKFLDEDSAPEKDDGASKN